MTGADTLLVCVTELSSQADIDTLTEAIRTLVTPSNAVANENLEKSA